MSRRPMKEILPEVEAARIDADNDRATLHQHKDTLNAAKLHMANLVTSATSTKAQVDQALVQLITARTAVDDARGDYDASIDILNERVLQQNQRQVYLQKFKNARDPLMQLKSFPKECNNTTLGHVLAYQLTELNAVFATVPSGTMFWQFSINSIDTSDDDMRRLIINKKEDLHISYKRWFKSPETVAALYQLLTAEGYTITREMKL